jgi:two-component system, OmpR family, KDP operon response regulator KdpE
MMPGCDGGIGPGKSDRAMSPDRAQHDRGQSASSGHTAHASAGQVVLVVDDEPAILRALTSALSARGYKVRRAETGQQAIDEVAVDPPDAVVLELGLPDIDGVDVCRRIRTWTNVPIIVLSADGADARKVLALDEGANDYVTKPYSTPELLARLRAVLRSATGALAPVDEAVLVVGDLRIDLARREVTVGERHVDLTPKEFSFLALLAKYPGRVLTHKAILQDVWGPNYGTETQYLRVYAGQIRKKLDEDMSNPRLVTELGVGYRLVARADEPH